MARIPHISRRSGKGGGARGLLAVALSALLAMAFSLSVFSPAQAQGPGVTVILTVTSSWDDGYVAEVRVENNGTTALNGWHIPLTFPSTTSLSSAWNVNAGVSGQTVTFENIEWNGNIQPGGWATFGFVADGPDLPIECPISGEPCDFDGDGDGNGDGNGDGDDPAPADTPVAEYGQLHVCGNNLCDEDGDPVQLTGMSSHGLQWFDHCLTDGSLDALATDWGADVLRISMYVQEGGYETDPRWFTDRVHELIEEATDRGMYAIVDWHSLDPGDPNVNIDAAMTFFAEIAEAHAGKENVLYEIANEPNGVSWSGIRGYAEQVIPVIRAEDPDSVVLVGTRGWSSLGVSEGSDHQEIVADPVAADNVMYTFHFYAASHGDNYLNTLAAAAEQLPIFVTEFGTQEYTGDGPNDFAMAQNYLDLMERENISWTNWNYSDDIRSGAAFNVGVCDSGGPWAEDGSLKPAGQWIRDRIREAALNPTG